MEFELLVNGTAGSKALVEGYLYPLDSNGNPVRSLNFTFPSFSAFFFFFFFCVVFLFGKVVFFVLISR